MNSGMDAVECRWRLDEVVLDPRERRVFRNGRELSLEPRAFDVLLYLFRNPGRVIPREELLDAVWRDRVVTHDAVYRAIRLARSVFGSRGGDLIKTVHGLGYRLASTPTPDTRTPETDRSPAASMPARLRRMWPRWLAIGIAGGALVLLFAGLPEPEVQERSEPSTIVAVLPFDDGPESVSIEYLGREIAAELSSELRAFPGLRILGPETSLAVASGESPGDILPGLPASMRVISGRVRPRSDEFSVTMELRDHADQGLLGQHSITVPRSQLYSLKTTLAAQIAEWLDVEDARGADYLARPRPNAYQRFLEARHLWRSREPAALDRAAQLLQQALEIAPDFARAYEALAAVYLVMPSWQIVDGESARARAYAAAREALRLDSSLGEARAILAQEASALGRWGAAARLFDHALADDPQNPTVIQWYAELLLMRGDVKPAAAAARQAVELDPVSAIARTVRAWTAIIAGDNGQALSQAQHAVELGMPSSNIIVAWAERRKGNDRAAAAALNDLLEPSAAIGPCRAALLDPGLRAEALAAIASSERRDQLALIYHLACLAMLDPDRSALQLLGDRDPGIEFAIMWAPEFRAVRQLEAFDRLMDRFGLSTKKT